MGKVGGMTVRGVKRRKRRKDEREEKVMQVANQGQWWSNPTRQRWQTSRVEESGQRKKHISVNSEEKARESRKKGGLDASSIGSRRYSQSSVEPSLPSKLPDSHPSSISHSSLHRLHTRK